MNPQQLQAYFDSNPAFQAEYNRVAALGDTRPPLQWLQDHMNLSPDTRTEYAGFQQQAHSDQAAKAIASYPQLASAFAAAQQANPALSPGDFIIQWANSNPNDPLLNDAGFLSAAGLEIDGGADMPLEQALLNYAGQLGYDDIDADVARKAAAEGLISSYAPSFNGARNTVNSIYDGSLLTSEYGANTEAAAAQQAALDAQMVQRRAGLDAMIAQMNAAQDPLNSARLDAANTAATGVNLGVQSERDRIMANFAQDGYVGSSTGTDAALMRASIGGRQQAADMLGQAKVLNATDTAGIARFGATEGRGLVDYGAGEQRNIADSAAQRRLGFFSSDVQRRLASLALPSNALQTEFQMRNMADDYGQSGFNRTMKNLQYFRTNPGQAPTSSAVMTKPVDSGYENLGAGLISVAGNIGNANNWWQTPKTATVGDWSTNLGNSISSKYTGAPNPGDF